MSLVSDVAPLEMSHKTVKGLLRLVWALVSSVEIVKRFHGSVSLKNVIDAQSKGPSIQLTLDVPTL